MESHENVYADPPPETPVAEFAPVQARRVKSDPIEVVMKLPRFSLKELLFIITFASIVFAVVGATWIAPARALIGFLSMTLTALLSIGLVHLTRRRNQPRTQ